MRLLLEHGSRLNKAPRGERVVSEGGEDTVRAYPTPGMETFVPPALLKECAEGKSSTPFATHLATATAQKTIDAVCRA